MARKFYVARAELAGRTRWTVKEDRPAFLENTFHAIATRGLFNTREEAREARRVLERKEKGKGRTV